jgi:hypothetical protein
MLIAVVVLAGWLWGWPAFLVLRVVLGLREYLGWQTTCS